MGERERYEPGTFCWADLGTDDLDEATAFYTDLFGWEIDDTPMGDAGVYRNLRLDAGWCAPCTGATPAKARAVSERDGRPSGLALLCLGGRG